jgi:hypothetical protein
MIRQVNLQQVKVPVNGFDQPGLNRQQVHRPDPAASHTLRLVRQLVLNVPGGQHWEVLIGPLHLPKTTFDSTLAFGQQLACNTFHSKSLSCG